MILTQLKRLAQLLMLLALQVLILNHMTFWGMGTPLLGVLLLVYMPMGTPRVAILLWAFALGLANDVFANTPGMGSAAMTLAAMLQPALLDMQAPKDAPDNLQPTYRTMGVWSHARYIFTLFLVHHTAYFALETFSTAHATQAALHLATSLGTSLLLVYSLETLRNSRQ